MTAPSLNESLKENVVVKTQVLVVSELTPRMGGFSPVVREPDLFCAHLPKEERINIDEIINLFGNRFSSAVACLGVHPK